MIPSTNIKITSYKNGEKEENSLLSIEYKQQWCDEWNPSEFDEEEGAI
jgi:hypothetical protein